jgi:hypothetical protein
MDETLTDQSSETDQPSPELGDAGKKALDAERQARRDAEKQAKEFAARLKEIEDRDKSEVDKLREQVDALTRERDAASIRMLRTEIAAEKGLTPAQAKRLVGATREELEADAAEILEAFPSSVGAKPPPTEKPTPDLRGGTDPTQDADVDIRTIVDSIPRL